MEEDDRKKETQESELKVKKSKSLFYRLAITVVFLSSLSMCVYQTQELVMFFLSDPIETQIKVTMNDVMEFPAITICNLNPVRRSRWMKRTDESEPEAVKQMPLSSQRTRKHSLSGRETTDDSSTSDELENDLVSHHLDNVEEQLASITRRSKKRVKRQQFLKELENLKKMVDANKLILDTVVQENRSSINQDVYNNIHSNISALWTSLNDSLVTQDSLESDIRDLQSRLSMIELATSEMADEMTRTKSYLSFLKANMSRVVDVTDNKTAESGGNTTVLPPSKDMQAFKDYLRNIGKMKKKDIEALGHHKEDFIAICSWQGSVCHPSHFDVFQNFMYGNCFTFNTSTVDAQVTGTGPYSGLSLSLFIEQDEYIDRVAPAAGARVVIHDFNYRPFPDEEGFSVAPGYTTGVFLRKTTTETVKPICDPDIEASYEHGGKKYEYSQKACLNHCLSNEILRRCNCAGGQFLLDRNTCSPDNKAEAQCVQQLQRLARKGKLPCYCPSSCRTTTYNPMISSAIWPAERYLPSLLEELVRVKHNVVDLFENITDFAQYFRKNFLRIDIFFQELMEQEMLQRYSYGIENLLSDIGGQLGLWIGVSVATLFESIETMSVLAIAILHKIRAFRFKWKRRRPHTLRRSLAVEAATPYKVDSKISSISHNRMISIHILKTDDLDVPQSPV